MSIARKNYLSELIQRKLIIIRHVIPVFPGFLPLSVVTADEYRSYILPYPPYADFNLTNRLSWNLDDTAAVSLLNGNLVLRVPGYMRKHLRTTLMGSNQLEQSIETLLAYLQADSASPQLELVPGHVVEQLPVRTEWNIQEDIDNHDHVFSTLHLVALDGRGFRHCRRAVRSFVRQFEPVTSFHKIDVTSEPTQEAMLRVFQKREGSKREATYKHELIALHRLFSMANDTPLVSYGVSINGRLCAFIVCEQMNASWMIGHFWKADTDYSGIYSYLMHRVSARLLRQGFMYLNAQQDLGIEGLRAFKQSFSPVMQLRKYTLTVRTRLEGAAPGTGKQHQ